MKLRDRDGIVTADRIIFRVYGYSHPYNAYVCDPEYAPTSIFKSKEKKALRTKDTQTYSKFYTDEGLQFLRRKYPYYLVWYAPLQTSLVGVHERQIFEKRPTDGAFQTLIRRQPTDKLLRALHVLVEELERRTNLSKSDFGVFGSLLHDFYHPEFSDLDMIIFGRKQLNELRQTLNEFYREINTPLKNEFEDIESLKDKHWDFRNYSMKEYIWHQRRKQVYGLFTHNETGRTIKVEFEPVKRWEEIEKEYAPSARIKRKGWIKMKAKVADDKDAAFMPSIYPVEPIEILQGKSVNDIQRVISYVEEFRMQAQKDEVILVEGNLEQVDMQRQTYHQVTLTYGAKYYEQTLKVLHEDRLIQR